MLRYQVLNWKGKDVGQTDDLEQAKTWCDLCAKQARKKFTIVERTTIYETAETSA